MGVEQVESPVVLDAHFRWKAGKTARFGPGVLQREQPRYEADVSASTRGKAKGEHAGSLRQGMSVTISVAM